MVAVFDHLPVTQRAVRQMVERVANSRGQMQNVPSFVSVEVLLISL